MKRIVARILDIIRTAAFLALFTLAGVHHASAFTPSHLWSRSFNASNAVPLGAAFDPSGNVIVVGEFSGTANFGGGTLTSAGGEDIFIAKYNALGVHQWSARFGSSLTDEAWAVGIDAASDIYVTGLFQGTINMGGSNLVSGGSSDVFIAKFNPSGGHVWSQSHGAAGNDGGYALAVNGTGLVVGGFFGGAVNFGGATLTSAGGSDVFLAKYNSAGTHQWSSRYGGTMEEAPLDLALDASGNVVMTGYFNGTASFGGTSMTSAGSDDIMLARYSSAGGFLSQQHFGSTSIDEGWGVAVDASGNVFTTGRFSGTVNFGGGPLVSAGTSIYLAKYTSALTHVWSQKFGSGSCLGNKVAVDAAGNVLATGYFSNTVDFGGGPLPPAGSIDAFLAKFTNAGAPVWSQRFGDTSSDEGRDVACDANGNVAIVGDYSTSIDLGGQTLTALTADNFIAMFAPGISEPVISSVADIKNDQGRTVKITFAASGEDDPRAYYYGTQYEAYRRTDQAPSQVAGAAAPASRRQLLDSGWTQVGSVSAHGKKTYSIDVPTIGDSTLALGQYFSVFKIRAATTSPYEFHDSPPDSGYSVDNLAPSIPSNLVYAAGSLSWNTSSAKDFDYFTVYGSNTNSFGAAVVINHTVTPGLSVNTSTYPYYFVTATDFSGNEGKPASLKNASGVGDTPTSYVLSVTNYPNPFNPRTTVKYTVPEHARVSVRVFDASGALVTTLFEGESAAGAYSVEWDGRDARGVAISSGVYFARIEQGTESRTKKMVMLK